MESLESKLERLSPVQRQEVEDFVDFLLSRGTVRDFPAVHQAPPPLMNGAPPPLTMIEPVHIAMTVPLQEPGPAPGAGPAPSPSAAEEPAGVIQEIDVGGDDGNYLDYGKFEQPSPSQSQLPSPATEAVKKVREKLSRREERDTSGHILEWID
jgi:hypothetical protein